MRAFSRINTREGNADNPRIHRTEKPDLILDNGDLPATAHELRELFSRCGWLFDRGVPVKVVPSPDHGAPFAIQLTIHRVVVEAHRLCRPVKWVRDGLVPITLPDRVARMYLGMGGEWNLPALAGICTAPLLSADGRVLTTTGYDPASQLWCANLPTLGLPEYPTRAEAETALRALRKTFRTFPFADAARTIDRELGVDAVNIDLGPGLDESAFLVGLLTAICRPSLCLAPGLLVRGPEISGAGIGKGLLLRSICAIAFGVQPRAFTKGPDRQELDKRLASDLIEAAPILFLDNVNGTMLRSDILASVLTERPARIRALGRTQMITLNSTAFIAVTGNGITVSEDLARRFIVCELDARCEDPEQRPFETGFLKRIEHHRPELLTAALTVWRWGRQAAADLEPGRPLGSFEDWSAWCRDPLLALGCRDPVDRIDIVKADDPERRRIVELFETWDAHHGERPIKAAELAKKVRVLIDPQGRGRQFTAAYLSRLTGTRAGGFVLTRQAAAGKWGQATYALCRTGSPASKT
jgi:putative DNA primase/helicase